MNGSKGSYVSGYLSLGLFLLPVVLVLFIYREVIFLPRFFYNGDTLFSFFGYFDYFLRGGDLITQNILSGFPVFVSNIGVWFYPLNTVAYKLFGGDAVVAYKVLNILSILLTYVFTYLYTRKIKLSHLGAIIAGLVFTFSGQLMLWSETLTNTSNYFLLPAVLLFIEMAVSRVGWRRILWIALSGLALGVGWLSGHLQYIVYIHTFAFLYAAYLWLKSKLTLVQSLYTILPAFAISFLVGLPQILAVLGWSANSARATGVSLSEFFSGAYLPYDIVQYLQPFFDLPVLPIANHNLYIGILPLALLISALFLVRRLWKEGSYSFYFVAFLFCFLASWKYSPLGLLLHELPLFSSFREAPRIMFLGHFAAALMIAICLEYIVSRRQELTLHLARAVGWIRRLLFYLVLPITALAFLARTFLSERIELVLSDYFFNNMYQGSALLPRSHYSNLIHNYINLVFDQVSILSPQVLILVAFLLLTYVFFRKLPDMDLRRAGSWMIVIITMNFALVYGSHFNTIASTELMAEPKTAKFISEQDTGPPFRVFTIMPGFTIFDIENSCPAFTPDDAFALQRELLLPNLNMLHDIDVIDGYDNFMSVDVSRALGSIGSEQSVTGNLLANNDSPLSDRIASIVASKDTLRTMNVRYVISHYSIDDPDFVSVYESAVGPCDSRLSIYELSGYLPRYFITPGKGGTYTEASQVVEVSYTYSSMRFDLGIKEDSNLFIGNAWLPGWKAYIDGEHTPILRAGDIYMSVEVPAGEHKVELRYDKPHTLKSIWQKL